MTTYTQPTREIEFLFRHVCDVEGTLEQLGNPVDLETCLAVVAEAGRFASGVLDPLNRVGDQQGSRCTAAGVVTPAGWKEAYQAYCEAGWNSLKGPEQYGGQALPQFVASAVEEAGHAANFAFCLCPMLTQAGIEALMTAGSEELKQRFLPKLISGEWTGTMNLTEPQAGSDLAAIKARAEREGDRYRLYGQKIFITYGDHDLTDNIIHMVLARSPDGPAGVKGLSLYAVPKFLVNADGSLGERNDVYPVSVEHKLGIHASPTAVMAYGERDGAIGYLIGEENRGIEYMFIMMNAARYAVGLEGLAISERAYQHARQYAFDRVQGRALGEDGSQGKGIVRHPDIRRNLLSMRSRIDAMRGVAYYAATQMDLAHAGVDGAQPRVDFLIPICKGWLTENGVSVSNDALQVFGGMGYVEETGAAQYVRDARIATIYEGTTGIQANDLIGRKTIRDGGAEAGRLLAEIKAVAEAAAAHERAGVRALGVRLQTAASALQGAVDWICRHGKDDQRLVFAGAVPYLEAWGLLCGGWLQARAALAAARLLDGGGEDPAFLEARLLSGEFFAQHHLVRVASLAETIVDGGRAALAFDDQQW